MASAPRSCPGVQIQRRRGWILRRCGELRRLPRPPRRGRACAASLPTPRSSSSRSPRWPPRAGTSLAPLHGPSVAAPPPRSGLTDPDPALARVVPVTAWRVRPLPWPAALAYRAPDAALARMDPALRRRRPGQAQQLQRRRLPLAEEVGSRGPSRPQSSSRWSSTARPTCGRWTSRPTPATTWSSARAPGQALLPFQHP